MESRIVSARVDVQRQLPRKVDAESESDSRKDGPLNVRREPKREAESRPADDELGL